MKKVKDPSLVEALKKGGPLVWASCLIMGLANIASGQIIMGLLYLAVEVGVIAFLTTPGGGMYWISMLPSLGDREMQEIWNDDLMVYEYIMGDQSQLILLYGIASLCVIALLVIAWSISVTSGYKAIQLKKAGVKVNFMDSLRTLMDENVHKLLMILPVIAIAIFTVLPLLYMMSMAFTDYNKDNNTLVLFNWVGLDNFKALFSSTNAIGKQFGSVLKWTLIWAFFATFLNFFLGTFVAILIIRKSIKF